MYKIELVTNNNTKILGYKDNKIDAEEYARIKVKDLKDFVKEKEWGIKIGEV